MKVVTNVEVMECLPELAGNNVVRIMHNGVMENETIIGQVFVNNRGEKIALGISQLVQDTIALPVNQFEEIKKDIERIMSENVDIRKAYTRAIIDLSATLEVNEKIKEVMQSADFFQRMKYFLTGNYEYLFDKMDRKKVCNDE